MTREELGGPLVSASGNRNGYVMEITEAGSDHAATTFRWLLFLVCGDPDADETYFGGYPKEKVSPISCPDNVAFDPAGHLWVATDGNQLGSHDGLFAVPTAGHNRGQVRQFLTVPVDAECSGPFITADGKTVFVAVQHPGEDSTFENPVVDVAARQPLSSPVGGRDLPAGQSADRSLSHSCCSSSRMRVPVRGPHSWSLAAGQTSRQESSSES
jgi:secreted PhoX family phosphatase